MDRNRVLLLPFAREVPAFVHEAGHSKWANIRHRKAAVDAKRANVFTKIGKEIVAAVRAGGANPKDNLRLAGILSRAKAANCPKANIESAIAKGAGASSDNEVEMFFEGQLGPVALYVHALSENRNRATMRVRSCLTKHNAHISGPGSAARLFMRRTVFIYACPTAADYDRLLESAVEGGADDVEHDAIAGEAHVVCLDASAKSIRSAMAAAGWEARDTKAMIVPEQAVPVDAATHEALERLLDACDSEDEIVAVFHNAAPPAEQG